MASTKANAITDPGRLDKILRIEEVVDRVPDGAGGYTEVWAPVPDGEEVWGGLEPLSGSEVMRAMQQRSNATHLVTIRYQEFVNAQGRIVWEGNIYQIVEPPRLPPDTRRTYMQFTVREEPVELTSVMVFPLVAGPGMGVTGAGPLTEIVAGAGTAVDGDTFPPVVAGAGIGVVP